MQRNVLFEQINFHRVRVKVKRYVLRQLEQIRVVGLGTFFNRILLALKRKVQRNLYVGTSRGYSDVGLEFAGKHFQIREACYVVKFDWHPVSLELRDVNAPVLKFCLAAHIQGLVTKIERKIRKVERDKWVSQGSVRVDSSGERVFLVLLFHKARHGE